DRQRPGLRRHRLRGPEAGDAEGGPRRLAAVRARRALRGAVRLHGGRGLAPRFELPQQALVAPLLAGLVALGHEVGAGALRLGGAYLPGAGRGRVAIGVRVLPEPLAAEEAEGDGVAGRALEVLVGRPGLHRERVVGRKVAPQDA